MVKRQDVRDRADGRDLELVDLPVRLGIVVLPCPSASFVIVAYGSAEQPTYLDVQEVVRLLEGRHVPVQVAHPLVKVRIPGPDVANIALEVLHVHGLDSEPRHQHLFFANQQPTEETPRQPNRPTSDEKRDEIREFADPRLGRPAWV